MTENELKKQVKNVEDSASRLEKAHVIGNLSFMHALGENHFDDKIEKIEKSIVSDIKNDNFCKSIQEIVDKLFNCIGR